MQDDTEELQGGPVRREIRISARPHVVYDFFVDPVKMLRWKGVEATLDPRPGGVYRVNINGRDVASGHFVELVPHSRIVFTWGWEGEGNPVPPGSSTVEVTLVPDGEGTLLQLVHSGLPDPVRGAHAEGWAHFLPRLAMAASSGEPGPDPWVTDAGL